MSKRSPVIAVIPARGGSKGLPNKNVKVLGDKPLIGWTIDAALDSKLVDRVIVTTDCPKIASVADSHGAEVPFLRPAHLADDYAKTSDVVSHVVETLNFSNGDLVLLQPTSPFRGTKLIDAALTQYFESDSSSLVSVTELDKSPNWVFWKGADNFMTPILDDAFKANRRQDLQKAYGLNGAIYIQSIAHFKATNSFVHADSVGFEMKKTESIDIDDIVDFQWAEFVLDKMSNRV